MREKTKELLMEKPLTKIVATLGPSSAGKENIRSLAQAGVNVFRLNFSHGTHDFHRENFKYIREVAKEMHTHFSILADMQGPKLRVGEFKNEKIVLQNGQKFRMDMNPELGDETRVALMHPEIFAILQEGMILLLNDGQIQLYVNDFGKDYMNTTVLVGGPLSNHKGVNVPDVVLPISALTQKDLKDLEFALEQEADWICLSFVQKPDDVRMARKIIGNRASIIVKIEKPAALNHLKEIIDLSDGIMVARGDLGVECPIESVPAIQRDIIEKCRSVGKPVIVATQMLESMIQAPVPTRAEVSDVATAVFEGADAVMLSAETAAGRFPVQAVQMMRRIIMTSQKDDAYKRRMSAVSMPPDKSIATAITAAMQHMVKVLENPSCIVTYSVTGKTTMRAARERVMIPILNLTVDERVANKLALVWGVNSVVTEALQDMTEVTPVAIKLAEELGFARSGNELIITAGIPFAKQGNTNILHIAKVE